MKPKPTCPYSLLVPMCDAECQLAKGHRGWHRFELKEKDCRIVVEWKRTRRIK